MGLHKMKKILEFDINDKRIQFLASTDSKLHYLIKYIGNVDLEIEANGFACIVKYIVGQQISDKARETIWKRLCDLCGDITPGKMVNQAHENMRKIGLTNRKIECIQSFSYCLIEKVIELEQLVLLPNEEIINKLISIKGIGRWTAEMYIIFSLGRIDVLSKGDSTIRRSIQWMYNLENLPSEKEVACYFKKWTGYETIVSLYFWRSISLGLQRTSFNNILSEGGSFYEDEP